jgi:hypothetical protein
MCLRILFLFSDQLYNKAKLIGDLVCLEIAKDSFVSKQVKPKNNAQYSGKYKARPRAHSKICLTVFCMH